MNLYLYLIYIKDFGNENESKTAVIEEQRVEFPKMLHFNSFPQKVPPLTYRKQ